MILKLGTLILSDALVWFLLNFNRVLSMKTFLIYFKFVILLKTALEIQCQLKEYDAWIFHEA